MMRSRRFAVLGVVVFICVALGAGSPSRSEGASASALATCTDSGLVPKVSAFLVSQGAPGYVRLARGKDTIVRPYLTTPDTCTPSGTQTITPRSATLDVTNNDGAQPRLTSAALTGTLTATAQVASPSDPVFLVPRSYLAPTATAADGTASITLTLTVTYDRTGATGQTVTATTTASIDKKTNALRILVVPLGDPSNTKAVQWSSAAQSELQNLLTNTARAYPVPSGTGDLSATATGGVRYVVSGALLDVKSLNLYKSSNGKSKFCTSGQTWSTSQVTSGAFAGHTLKGDLYQRLQDYNRVNNPPADIVIGVADGAIAWKSTDGLLCDDGRAATPTLGAASQVGWVRVADYAAGDPANYPSPLTMELLHTFGIVNQTASLTYHSPSVESDAAGPDRGYNGMQLKPISTANGALGVNDHSVMNYNTTSIPFTKDNTALEPRDWTDALCDFGGVDSTTGALPFANCTLAAAVGTSAGVAAGNTMYGVSGIVTGGVPRVTDAGIVGGDSSSPIGLASGSSPLNLLACTGGPCNGTNTQHTFPLAVFADAGHGDGGINVVTDGNGFGAVVPVDTAWTDFALQLNGGTPVPVGDSGSTPDVVSTSSSAPFLLREFPAPACCNGRAIAFDGTSPSHSLYVTVASPDPENSSSNTTIYKLAMDGERTSSYSTGGRVIGSLAFDPANGHLYAGDYTRPESDPNGTGKVFDVTFPDNANFADLFTFTDPGCALAGSLDGLEWLGDKFAIGGDECTKVFFKNKTGADVLPSFTTGQKSGITTDGSGNGLWISILNSVVGGTKLVHTNLQGDVDNQFSIDGYEAEDLAYDSVTFAPNCAVWMNQATEETPSIRAYQVPCGATPNDTTPPAVTFTATDAKYATVYFTCGDPSDLNAEKFPIVDGLDPVATQGQVQTFSFYWSANNLSCGPFGGGSPKVLVSVSDGFTHSPLTDAQAQLAVTSPTKPPFASIAAPMGSYPENGTVHFEGAGWDPEEGDLLGSALKWYEGTTQIGTGKSFELLASVVGPHSVKLDVTDAQGHTDSASGTYFVMYSAGQCAGDAGRTVLQPMNADGSSVFKKGNTIPIKFRVCDRSGTSIGTPGVVLPTSSPYFKVPQGQGCVQPTASSLAAPVFCAIVGTAGSVDESVFSTASDTSFRWDGTEWIFNMSTSNLSSGVKVKYYIPLNDGTYIFFTFGLK